MYRYIMYIFNDGNQFYNIIFVQLRLMTQITQNITQFTFTFIHLADAFMQSDLQLRNAISNTL